MLKFRSIQFKLFVTYSILITAIVAIAAISFYYYVSDILSKRDSESIFQSTTYISTQLDSLIQNIDNAAVKVIFSDDIKQLFFEEDNPVDPTISSYNVRKMNDYIFSIMGPIQLDWQINLFDMNGRFFGTGNNSVSKLFPGGKMNNMAWVQDTLAADGAKVISPPHSDDWDSSGKTVISLARVFSWALGGKQQGILEIQQSYTVMANLIGKLMAEPNGGASANKSIYIYNQAGNLIYPYSNRPNAYPELYWKQLQRENLATGTSTINNPLNKQREIMAYTHSDYTNWIVVAVESENVLLQPVVTFRNSMFIAVFGLLLITLIVSFFVARGLTSPIKEMHKSIRALRVDTLLPSSQIESNTSLNELDILNTSFKRMCIRLQDSIEEVIQSRSQEMQARMVALQSQMNPHFLYNTITLISIMAEEKEDHDIVKVCKHLSKMLRYILSNHARNVTMSDEVAYAASYLTLMQIRYGEKLRFQIDVDPAMMEIAVPILIIQPIVENCMKYGIHVAPPWKIELTGRTDGEKWTIHIRDYGGGFTPEALQALSQPKLNLYAQESQGKGLGLKNIAERLQLLYGEEAIFEASNHPEGGAWIVIGGLIRQSVQDSKPSEEELAG
ncbi:histidine kinase [Paenibacillus sp. HWE-109]|uniref:cache domain-containing sensor histidine kinase n=1 Tax=Paenibacillus sp. HWE-109 TaxID=1306526 RepID=UPI001EDE5B71|nr:histidine kinase [Paenibacillus sp. HWE-109]UKS29437.1 histidine kinase [Paenibacillus sp. HWE-109]